MTAAGAALVVRRTPPTIQSVAMQNTALSRFSRAVSLAIATALVSAAPASASGTQRLTIGDLTSEPSIAGRAVTGLAWRPHSTEFSYLVRKGAGEEAVFELWLEDADAAKGGKRVLVSTPALVIPAEDKSPAQDKSNVPPDADRPPGRRRVALEGYRWSPDGQALLLAGDHDLWIYRLPAGKLDRLTHTPEDEDVPTFSPDGRKIAFVRGNDLYALELASGRETRLTSDGSEHVLNGKLDWVYQEELGSRSGQAYQWSPDGQAIAYLRLDDGPIADAPIVDFLAVPAKVSWQRYPKAGAVNPIPSFRIVGADGTSASPSTAHFELERDGYVVPGFSWTLDSRAVCFRTLTRAQDREEVRLLDRTGANRVLFVEEDPAWINVLETPRFLPDGRFLWKSERSGFQHLYVGSVSGSGGAAGGTGALQAITHGDWMVDHIAGVDPKKNVVYFTATEESPRRRPIYRVGLDGKGFAKLPGAAGTHTPELSEDGRFLLDTFSTVSTPPVVSLLDAKTGKSLRVVDRPDNRLSEFDLGKTEEVEVTAEDGTKLLARLLKPANFDASKKYPVIVYVYGGPHAQLVRDQWGPGQLLDAMLAEKGFLVWTLDNRGSWGRGHAFEAPLLRETGKHELADQLAGVRYLKGLPYVDGSRIGIWGWSYGGYMTLYSITNAPDVWKCAVAGAPVTNWKFYDTIYTERYMRTPAENPKGYEASAPLSKARSLKAKLLIIHGTADDNVHIQNSIAFIDALTKWDRPYELQVQPGQKHGFRGKTSLDFRNEAIVKFFEANL
jgi:dipeptidyl-peptidase-4